MNREFEKAYQSIFNNEGVKDETKRDKEYWTYKKIYQALLSYKKVLGIPEDQEFENYCSACCPVWFDKGWYGVGPNPNPTPGVGMWHGQWERRIFPIGSIETDDVGNMRYTKTRKPVKITDGDLFDGVPSKG